MKLVLKFTMLIFVVLFSMACAVNSETKPPLHTSSDYYNFIQPSFNQYVAESEQWLSRNRVFLSDDKDRELAMNMPFEKAPRDKAEKAILLVHGLGDSPFSFADVSRSLVQQGFHVQALLLPGHGSDPQHMMLSSYQDWQRIVDHYATLLKGEYAEVWLGGYSTGANLVTLHALAEQDISGLLLFSPGFQSKALFLEKFTPAVAAIWPYGWQSNEVNLAKYTSAPVQGAVNYSKSAKLVREALKVKQVSIPTLIVISEHDSVVDASAIESLFSSRFTHSNSRLIWYGETQFSESNIMSQSMQIPGLKISSGSHMSTLFAPCNHYYGIAGSKKMCNNGLTSSERAFCENSEDVWFSAWGYSEKNKIHARLTWNPHYAEMSRQIAKIVKTPNSSLLAQRTSSEDK